ncbi:lipocalin family protein [Novispirillum itersonii]|uniref:Outer membrane lipoprotein Blc n=1 Tax=Novispirillum itersonii TaxID=189 RepID=A0A7W9ZG38_NOVIT|nr:lipocalin family protein [Novispirillum itersonii]MBB6210775.1 apolipoprotein D and lipocalin family protein [Novispirillum itersonii]
MRIRQRISGGMLAVAVCLSAISLSAAARAADAVPPVVPVPALDVPRYMGVWYEAAKFPNRFQAQCARGTSATYALRDDGRVTVTNRCFRADGGREEAVGEARAVGSPSPAVLEVRFAPAWLSWLPMVWGDYWIVDLDEAYTLAAVSEPRREYLWILSRTPVPDPAAYQALLGRLKDRGYDLTRLEVSAP